MLRRQINLANMIALTQLLVSRHKLRMGRCLSAGASIKPAMSRLLKNPGLFGRAREAPHESIFRVHNPADPSSPIADVTMNDQKDARSAIERSHAFLPSWRDGTTAPFRSNLLLRWSRLIQENADDIATIMALESGKPLNECKGEIAYGVSFLDFYAAEALRPSSAGGGFLVPTPFSDATGAPRGQILAMQQAVGVCALIAPWNFPFAMITRKVAPALASGCTVVVKPAELTPLTAIALHQLALEVGVPADAFQLVTTSRESTPLVGEEFCTNPKVQKVSFTGSTAVGKLLMQQCSGTVKRLSLELGGNAPFVVFQDAALDQAVAAAISSKYRNAGQTCVCADRFLVHADIHDEFVRKLVDAVQKQIVVGSGLDPATTMGPLITAAAVEHVHEKVKEAVQLGARLWTGGVPLDELGSHFYAPTVLTDVPPEARIWRTETFGPVAALMKFDSDEQALELANDSSVGLASYFCTKDLSRAFAVAKSLEAGLVGVNEGIISTALAPFGGVKESGLGREGSALGIQEFLETKYVFMNY